MKLILLGAPGAGKGTQAEYLAKYYQLEHISTGDIFRANLKEKTELGLKAKEFMDQGLLVPDEVTNNMVKNKLTEVTDNYILDGYPRTINQAEFLSKFTEIDKAINFTLAEEVVVRRLSGRRTCSKCKTTFHIDFKPPTIKGICDKCGGDLIQRDDEKPKTIIKRLEVYHEQTAPLIEYYKKLGKLVDIDASAAIDEVFEEVKKSLSE